MIMESPVRIYIGAALVVNLLVIISTTVNASTLSLETTSTTIRSDRNPKYVRVSSNWAARNKSKLPDVAINELNPKDSTSEEHSEKNAKYKDRGRVKYNIQSKFTTESTFRRVSPSTKAPEIIIVTPTPEAKKPAQIIDSMRAFKKTRMPSVTIFSTSEPTSSKSETNSNEEYTENEYDEDKETFDQFSSTKFQDNSFFTMPTFDIDEFSGNKYNSGHDKETNDDFSTPSFGSLSSFFPKSMHPSNDERYKSDSFFDFNLDLTTPKNDFFDKKFQEVSSSILDKLDTIKSKTLPASADQTKIQKVDKKRYSFDKSGDESPTNKSSVYIKNTKEIRFLDNDKAGSSNALSDVQGTSIFYKMTVLSTETYNITDTHDDDDDCDSDTTTSEPTSDSTKDKKTFIKTTTPTVEFTSKSSFSDSEPSPVSISPVAFNFYPSSTARAIVSSAGAIPVSTLNTLYTTQNNRIASSTYGRNRNYSKRLNLSENKDSSNSVFPTSLSGTVQSLSNQGNRQHTRKFHYTTPKIKPIWMAPRRNITRTTYPRVPTTIYSEHFDIKDKTFSTHKPKLSIKTVLTTQPSDIDPVLQSDVSGTKKVGHSQAISDNTIPSLWKRGSTKFSSSTAATADNSTGIGELEIPPTLTAWALASMRRPPSLSNPVVNTTGPSQKNVDENELQKVGEIIDKKETSTSPTTTVPSMYLNNDFETKNITEIYQNKLPIKSVSPTTSKLDTEVKEKQNETNSERVPAESNISLQNSKEILTTEEMKIETDVTAAEQQNPKTSWIPVIKDNDQVTPSETKESSKTETIPPVDATKSTGFESITKLPASITTPKDDTVPTENENVEQQKLHKAETTTDYEITTIRFSYVPTEDLTTEEETETIKSEEVTDWHPVFPTRTSPSTFEDTPITTYRPRYVTSTEEDQYSTVMIDTTPQLEVSSQIIEESEQKEATTSVTSELTEENTTMKKKTVPITTELMPDTTVTPTEATPTESEVMTQGDMKTSEKITPIDTTTVVVSVVTEINSERVPVITTEMMSDTETTSEENSDSNEVIILPHKTPVPVKPEIITTTRMPTTTSTTTTPTPTTTTTTKTTTPTTTTPSTTTTIKTTTQKEVHLVETTTEYVDLTTKSVNDLEDLTSYAGDITTESSSRVLSEEPGSGAAIAIAVSTIGVIALVLLVGLLLVVRRRGRRGVYAQRCTPVSLDAYSLDSVSVGHRKGNQRLRASKRSYGNPAYDDEVTSHPMTYAALANFALDVDSITAEFAEIPSVTVRPEEVPPGCEDKNRYSNVLPLPETRVPLKRIGNDPTTEYINANFITGPGNIRRYYIASQAPLAHTVSDFWRMIWEQNSRLVVMLTEYMENGVEKSYEYLPPSEISDNKRTFGDYQIILKKREQRDKYAISSIQLINLVTRTWREVTHLWYFWPAKGVPEDYDSVIDFLSEMRSYMKISQTAKEYDEDGVEVIYEDQNRSSYHNLTKLREENGSNNGVNVYSPAKAEELLRRGQPTNGTLGKMKAASEIEGVRPCVVVCASGAGRSMALVAAELCARALAAGRADVPRAVRALRLQRPHALSNRHHYVFLYRLLSEYGNRLMGGGVDAI